MLKTDFEYTTFKGGTAKLYSAVGEKILLFFYRPDCPICKVVKRYVAKSDIDKLVLLNDSTD